MEDDLQKAVEPGAGGAGLATVAEVPHAVALPEAGTARATPPWPAPLPPLWRNRDYMLLWSGQVVSVLGSTIAGIAMPLLILALTGSPGAAGIAAALGVVPYVLFSLPAGALIDRWDRKRVMLLCDLGRALNIASVPLALAFGMLTVWQLYLVALIEGTLFVFFDIAEVAALPQVVDKRQLADATGQNQATFAISGLLGPALGGFLYQAIGRAAPFVADALSYSISVLSLLLIRRQFQGERAAPPAGRRLRGEIREGLGWLWRQPVLRFMAFLTGGFNFTTAGLGLFVIVSAQAQGASEAAIGAIFSVGAVGGLLGSALAGRIQRRFTFGQVIVASLWLTTLTFPVYALAPPLLVLGAVSGVFFFCVPIYSTAMISYRLPLIPDALQGRVNSAFRLLAFGFIPPGSALAGLLIEQLGVGPAVLVFSACMVGISLVVTFNTGVRNARYHKDEHPA